jgi:hypothetical protein
MAGSFHGFHPKDEPADTRPTPDLNYFYDPSLRDTSKMLTSDVQLRIGESRDAGFALMRARNDV